MKRLIIIAFTTSLFITFSFAQASKQPAASKQTAQASINRGEIVYTTYCIACHQANGGGVPNLNPPLIKTTYVLGDKKKLVSILLKGMNEEVEIDGNYFSNNMPPQQLKDQEIADVLTYIRNSFGNKASAVTVAEVTTARKSIK